MNPQPHEEHIQHTFDAYCKKVLRNEARDYLDELERRRSREISLSELPIEVMDQLSASDSYFQEDKAFCILGCTVYVDDSDLAEAIAALPRDKQDIILLFYFLEMSDYEIAKRLNMVRRSVTYRRTSTLKLLKELIGGNTDEKQ
mgnify:FL=1